MSTETDIDTDPALQPWEIAHQRYACDCEDRRLTVFRDRLLRSMYRYQCPRCGEGSQYVAHATLTEREKAEAAPYDETIQDRWVGLKRSLADRIHEQRRERSLTEFRSGHEEFLASPEWQDIRRRVFARAGQLCEGCRRRVPTEVHHKSYARKFGREMLFDLVAVCRLCHEAIHDPDDRRV